MNNDYNNLWYKLQKFQHETGVNFWHLRWYLRLCLIFTAGTLLLLAIYFCGVLF